MTYPAIKLQPNRARRVTAGHPWIYSNEVAMDAAAKALPPGELVQFRTSEGKSIGIGCFHPHNLICGRLFARPDTTIDTAWFGAKLQQALTLRQQLFDQPFYRLVHAEADGLPGLIIDRYGDHLVAQLNCAGIAMQQEALLTALDNLIQPTTILLRNDSAVRVLEGLPQEIIVAKGALPEQMTLEENGLQFFAHPGAGQKTGWFYDQRHNRALTARFAHGARVLDVYCHTGGFALNAAAAGAKEVVGIDASELALACAKQAAEANRLSALTRWERGDAFEVMADFVARKEKFGLVIVDPPAFIKSRRDIGAGTRGYRKLVKLAATLVQRGGFLFVASCSHHLTLESLVEQIAAGLGDASREGQVLHTVFAAPDHPVHPHLPESAYLKGQLLRLTV